MKNLGWLLLIGGAAWLLWDKITKAEAEPIGTGRGGVAGSAPTLNFYGQVGSNFTDASVTAGGDIVQKSAASDVVYMTRAEAWGKYTRWGVAVPKNVVITGQ